MIGRSALFARNAISQFVRHGSHGGCPGEVRKKRLILLHNDFLISFLNRKNL